MLVKNSFNDLNFPFLHFSTKLQSFQEAEAILEEINPSPVQVLSYGLVRLNLHTKYFSKKLLTIELIFVHGFCS